MTRVYVIHGLMGTAAYHFGPQIEAWNERYTVIPIDLPGHGSTREAATEPYFGSALNWVAGQIRTRGPGHLVGLSLGASVAIHMGLEHPELCESLVLTGYAPVIPANMTDLMEQQYHMFLAIQDTNPALAKEFEALHGERWHNTLKAVLTDMTYHYPAVAPEQIRTLSVPTLVLNGSAERHEREAACDMANLNDQVEAGLVPGAGHTAEMQQPDAYTRIVEAFWDRVRQPR